MHKPKGKTNWHCAWPNRRLWRTPARPDSYVALGDFYAAQGEPDYARNYYDEALSIDPVTPSALKAIAALKNQLQAQNQTKPVATATP